MLTEFGKYLRKLRIDCNETLAAMARKLGVTASYLSCVETGKRSIPNKWFEKIAQLYKLDDMNRNELLHVGLSSVNKVNVDVEDQDDADKTLVLVFARRLPQLSQEEKDALRKILMEGEFQQ